MTFSTKYINNNKNRNNENKHDIITAITTVTFFTEKRDWCSIV